MPRYEYECPDCGHAFEACRSVAARHKTDCMSCGTRAKLLISLCAIQTEDNNPLKGLSRQLGADCSTRAKAKYAFESRGLIMADENACDSAARSHANEVTANAKVVEDGIREYNKLPAAMRKADTMNVAAADAEKAKLATSTVIGA